MYFSPEIKEKIDGVSHVDFGSGIRLQDYFGNQGYVLEHKDDILRAGDINHMELYFIECYYKKLVEKLLVLSTPEIVTKLVEHKPLNNGTNANIESIHEAFGIK